MEQEKTSKTSKAQQRATNKYIKNHYDRINLTLPMGYKEKIREAAATTNESVNAFIIRAIDELISSICT